MTVVAFATPFMPFAGRLGFVRIPWALLAMLSLITVLYVGAVELGKRAFYGPGVRQS